MEAKKAEAKAEKLYPVKLTHDYWTGNNVIDESTGLLEIERIKAGQTIEVTAEVALMLIEKHKAERADPLT